MIKGRIVKIEKNVQTATYLKQGVKKEKQGFWDAHYPGSNGTYVTGSEYLGTSLDVKIYIFDYNYSVVFDIREQVLKANGCQRLSSSLLEYIKQNVGKKVVLEEYNGELFFNPYQLEYFIRNK